MGRQVVAEFKEGNFGGVEEIGHLTGTLFYWPHERMKDEFGSDGI